MRCVFIGATSRDLGSYRRAVHDVLLNKDVLPVLQDRCTPDYRIIVEMLEDTIRRCDTVICLVGFVYRQDPRQRPVDAPRYSYTQSGICDCQMTWQASVPVSDAGKLPMRCTG